MEKIEKPKKIRQLKKSTTVRERAEKSSTGSKKPRLLKTKTTISTAAKPFKHIAKTGRKEYYLPLPDNKVGRFLNKRRKFIPKYFRNAWVELKLVEWPSNKETFKLTFAVFLFAIFFMIFVSAADYGLDKVFKKLILE